MNISPAYEHQLKHGTRHTFDVEIAVEMSKRTGQPSITFISPKVKDAYVKAYPDIFGPAASGKSKKEKVA